MSITVEELAALRRTGKPLCAWCEFCPRRRDIKNIHCSRMREYRTVVKSGVCPAFRMREKKELNVPRVKQLELFGGDW